jgi:septal ring factor EnvC (AmiA/AmiB activator)
MPTVIRNAFGWALGHVRLIIEYALLALVVTLAGAVLYGRIHAVQQDRQISDLANHLSNAASTINEQAQANRDQDAAIAKLHELRELDGEAIAGLNRDLHQVGAKSDAIRSKLAQLEKRNAQAKALLDTPVPDAVGCVLDDRPCPTSDAHQGRDHHP